MLNRIKLFDFNDDWRSIILRTKNTITNYLKIATQTNCSPFLFFYFSFIFGLSPFLHVIFFFFTSIATELSGNWNWISFTIADKAIKTVITICLPFFCSYASLLNSPPFYTSWRILNRCVWLRVYSFFTFHRMTKIITISVEFYMLY